MSQQDSRSALLQLYIWMGNSGMGKDHPWVLFIEKHLRETPDPEQETKKQLRDQFAAAVMPHFLNAIDNSRLSEVKDAVAAAKASGPIHLCAIRAFEAADLMLAARGA